MNQPDNRTTEERIDDFRNHPPIKYIDDILAGITVEHNRYTDDCWVETKGKEQVKQALYQRLASEAVEGWWDDTKEEAVLVVQLSVLKELMGVNE